MSWDFVNFHPVHRYSQEFYLKKGGISMSKTSRTCGTNYHFLQKTLSKSVWLVIWVLVLATTLKPNTICIRNNRHIQITRGATKILSWFLTLWTNFKQLSPLLHSLTKLMVNNSNCNSKVASLKDPSIKINNYDFHHFIRLVLDHSISK